jgi:hypothetical protein
MPRCASPASLLRARPRVRGLFAVPTACSLKPLVCLPPLDFSALTPTIGVVVGGAYRERVRRGGLASLLN